MIIASIVKELWIAEMTKPTSWFAYYPSLKLVLPVTAEKANKTRKSRHTTVPYHCNNRNTNAPIE
jgi:hypothetical protein